jgi:hypothetical protein
MGKVAHSPGNAMVTVIFSKGNVKVMVKTNPDNVLTAEANLLATSVASLAIWLGIVLKKGVITNRDNVRTIEAKSPAINVARLVIWQKTAPQEAAVTFSQDNATKINSHVIDVGKLATWLVTAANPTLVKIKIPGNNAWVKAKVHLFVTDADNKVTLPRTVPRKRTMESKGHALNVENLGI